MKRVLVYVDEGVGPRSLQQLLKALRDYAVVVSQADRNTIINTEWDQETDVLIIPGGRDVPYHDALNGKGTDKIRGFVEKGGNYFGICAGAYFGCRSIHFALGTEQAIEADRNLSFFPGKAIGPAYGNTFDYATERGAQIAQLKLQPTHSQSFSYFNGGCYFHPSKDAPFQVIANYSDLPGEPAAIIECQVGKGKALLCGVHPEYSASQLKGAKDPYLQKLIPQLDQIEQERKELFTHLLGRLNLDLR